MTSIARYARQIAAMEGYGGSGGIGEWRVAKALRALGFKDSDYERQFRLGPYRIDFAFPACRIAIEADGWVHTTLDSRRRDRRRDRGLETWGWRVMRIDVDGDVEYQIALALRSCPVAEHGRRCLA